MHSPADCQGPSDKLATVSLEGKHPPMVKLVPSRVSIPNQGNHQQAFPTMKQLLALQAARVLQRLAPQQHLLPCYPTTAPC